MQGSREALPLPTPAPLFVPKVVRPAPRTAVPPDTTSAPHAEPSLPDAPTAVAVRTVLQGYEDAYDRLDAAAATAVWPGVDTRALSRAFAQLGTQDLALERCTVQAGATTAEAECVGVLRHIRRVGNDSVRDARHIWRFQLERVDHRWRIGHMASR